MAEIYEAVEAFATQLDGVPIVVGMGDTVREGHPLQVKHPKAFRLIRPTFEYTPPPKKPPLQAPKPAARVAAAPASADAKADDKKG